MDDKILINKAPERANVATIVFKGRRTKLKDKRAKPEAKPDFRLPQIQWDNSKVLQCQMKDESTRQIINYLENNVLPQDDKTAREIVLSSDVYLLHDNILYHLLDAKSKDTKRQIEEIRVCLVVPKELRFDVLTSMHGDLNSGHYGTQRTYSTLRLKYYWKGMYSDCKNFVLSCKKCSTKKKPVAPKAPLQPLEPARINARWAMDIVHMPMTPRGNKYILTFTEYCSRYIEAFPLPNTQATTVASVLVNEICFRFGTPQEILSDLGSNFISELVAQTCKLLGIERIYTTPYHPQTKGLLEKFHSTLAKNLSMYVSADHTDWDIYVRAICYGYNTSICIDSTQFSPFFLVYGREPFYPLDTILPNMQEAPCQVHEHILKLAHAREVAMTNVKESQEIIKRKYDRNATQEPLQPGELVWIFYPEINLGGSPKLFHNWSGPYLLMEKISPTNFKVIQAHDLKPLKNPIHINRMKRFHHRAITPPTPENLHSLQHGDPVPQIQELHVGEKKNVINNKTCDLKELNRLSQEASQLEPLQVLTKDNDNRDDTELPDPPVLRTEEESRLPATA